MTGLLSEIGKKLAERWVSLLVLPGMLFLATGAAAHTLGQRHALDAGALVASFTGTVNSYEKRPMAAVLAAVGVLLAAAAAGVVARGLALLVERVWFASGPRWLVGWAVRRRQERWRTANEAYETIEPGLGEDATGLDARRARLAAARNNICLCPPARPTWIGDRLRSAGIRARNEYGLDLTFAWPRLWMLLSDGARAELRVARSELLNAATLAAWGALYTLVGIWWWPSAVAGLCTATVAWRQARRATANLADLVEATADLYGRELSAAVGIDVPDGQLTPQIGHRVSERLRKGA